MRSLIASVALLMLLCGVHHQSPAQFYLGATGSLSRTSLSGDAPTDASYTPMVGFGFGAIVEYALTEDLRISAQPSFARRGTGVAYDIHEDELRDSLSLAIEYASIPVMARFLSPGGSWFVNGGLDFGFLLGATLEDLNVGSQTDAAQAINDFDVMAILGVGASLPIDPARVTLEVRYGQSILNAGANDQLAAAAGIPLRFRSSGFQFLAAILFPL
jgi:hypothetical protein